MNGLLAEILDAHGGMNRWNEYRKVEVTIVSGGGLFQRRTAKFRPAFIFQPGRAHTRADLIEGRSWKCLWFQLT